MGAPASISTYLTTTYPFLQLYRPRSLSRTGLSARKGEAATREGGRGAPALLFAVVRNATRPEFMNLLDIILQNLAHIVHG